VLVLAVQASGSVASLATVLVASLVSVVGWAEPLALAASWALDQMALLVLQLVQAVLLVQGEAALSLLGWAESLALDWVVLSALDWAEPLDLGWAELLASDRVESLQPLPDDLHQYLPVPSRLATSAPASYHLYPAHQKTQPQLLPAQR
jgi:hypothetical protein